ncbi:glycosyltransferase family 2 protein [Cupriavidus gilardii]|uniref:glycosyltransferase family 2 protein n=1 Tax=Cupriavidus gilardii TaxID=82541 RepID=UPI001EE4F5B4|nr:glycosyltransferase [Cupriavidus gilardii]
MKNSTLTVSVVSHGQGVVLTPLLAQLSKLADAVPLQVIVTENLPRHPAAIGESAVRGYGFDFIANASPKGFGANHNAAFFRCSTSYFCVLNPDLVLAGNPFLPLTLQLARQSGIAVPTIVSPDGVVEDSVRRLPTMTRLLGRAMTRRRGAKCPPDYPADMDVEVDWAAGMFMVFNSDVYRELGGFDERFHLYCEDVDICLRSWLHGWPVVRLGNVKVIHDARRDSHRQLRYLLWHLGSLFRLFTSAAYWGFRLRRMPTRKPIS